MDLFPFPALFRLLNEIDKELALFGWHYNAAAEVFQATADDSIIEWLHIVVALPGLSINELAAL